MFTVTDWLCFTAEEIRGKNEKERQKEIFSPQGLKEIYCLIRPNGSQRFHSELTSLQ